MRCKHNKTIFRAAKFTFYHAASLTQSDKYAAGGELGEWMDGCLDGWLTDWMADWMDSLAMEQ